MTELDDGLCVVNLCAHDIVLVDAKNGDERIIPMDPAAPLRLNTRRQRLSKYLVKVEFSTPTQDIPKRPGLYYIVSSAVKVALKGERDDLVTPNDLIRDYSGQVTACRSFAI